MKALLIGGTGTISLSITKLLLQKGWDVTLLNRGNRPVPDGAESLIADAANEPEVAALIKGRHFDVVADFIAFTRDQVARDIRLFENLCNQYIFISSASAYQKPISLLPITESTPLYNPFWQYSRDKIDCENTLLAAYRESAFPLTIVRPSHTYDKTKLPLGLHGNGGSWPVARRILAGKPVLVHGDGESLWTLTHARDFAKAFVGLCANPHAIGEAVHITSDESLSWNAIYRALGKALGREANLLHVASDTIIAKGKQIGFDFEGGLLGDKVHSVIFDNTKIKRLVPGWCAATRFDVGVRETVENILAHPELQTTDDAFDVFCDSMVQAV